MRILNFFKWIFSPVHKESWFYPKEGKGGGGFYQFREPSPRWIQLHKEPESCAVCRFAGSEIGFERFPCRHSSPVAEKVDPSCDTLQWIPRFPIMKKNDWCGDFERRTESGGMA